MTTAIIAVVLSAFSIGLGALYFVSNRRYAESREAREELRAVQKEQECIKERMAVMEKTAEFLKQNLETTTSNTDRQIQALAQTWNEIHRDLKTAVEALQQAIMHVRVEIAKKS